MSFALPATRPTALASPKMIGICAVALAGTKASDATTSVARNRSRLMALRGEDWERIEACPAYLIADCRISTHGSDFVSSARPDGGRRHASLDSKRLDSQSWLTRLSFRPR